MAYLTSERLFSGNRSSERPASDALPSPPTSGLTAIERSVVQLSRADTLSSLAYRGSWSSRLRRLIGTSTPNRLADPRLETLRRFAVILRLRSRVTDAEVHRFLKAGFGASQFEQIERTVAPWRRSVSRSSHCAAWLVLILAAGLTFRTVAAAVDEKMIGLVAAGLGFINLAPMLLPKHRRSLLR